MLNYHYYLYNKQIWYNFLCKCIEDETIPGLKEKIPNKQEMNY